MADDEPQKPPTRSRRRRRRPPDADPKPTGAQASTASESPTGDTKADPDGPTSGATAGSADDRMDLPKWNRARVKRKAPAEKDDDAFTGTVRKAGRGMVQRAPVVLGAIVVVAAAAAGIVYWQQGRAEKSAVATRILASAVGVQTRGRVGDVETVTKDRVRPYPIPIVKDEEERKAQVGARLDELSETASATPAAALGELVAAARDMEAGDFGTAQQRYQAFLADVGRDHELAFVAREGLALALEASGDAEGALRELDALAGNKGAFYRDQALWQKGRLLEAQGRGDEATEVYKLYAEEFKLGPSSLAGAQVKARLEQLAPEAIPQEDPEQVLREGLLPQGLVP